MGVAEVVVTMLLLLAAVVAMVEFALKVLSVLSVLFAVLVTTSVIIDENKVVSSTVTPLLSVDSIVLAISITDVVKLVVDAALSVDWSSVAVSEEIAGSIVVVVAVDSDDAAEVSLVSDGTDEAVVPVVSVVVCALAIVTADSATA